MSLMLVKLSEKNIVGLKFSQQGLDSIGQLIHTLLVLEKVFYVSFYLAAKMVICLQHTQKFIKIQVEGLESLIRKDRKNSLVDEFVR